MDKVKAAADIVAHALPIVPFEGWTQSVLMQAAADAGYKKTDAIRVFPGGAPEAVEEFLRQGDAKMRQALQHYHLDAMKIRERIAVAVRLRIEADASCREAVRKATALLALPLYAHRGLRSLYHTVDAIWYAIGDASTDFNFYTKRLMLAGVYASTLLHWLDDRSPGHAATWAFLDRRIANVMTIEKTKYQMKEWLGRRSA